MVEVLEQGRVLDTILDYGCVQLIVKGVRTGIEYQGCKCQMIGRFPRIGALVQIESRDLRVCQYAFMFREIE